MSTIQPLNTSGNVVIGNDGNGQVVLSPLVGQKWTLSIASVHCDGTAIPTCSIYIGGSPTPDFFVDGTYTGNLDSTDRVANYPIYGGQKIFAVWSGATSGATATLSLLGTVETGRS